MRRDWIRTSRNQSNPKSDELQIEWTPHSFDQSIRELVPAFEMWFQMNTMSRVLGRIVRLWFVKPALFETLQGRTRRSPLLRNLGHQFKRVRYKNWKCPGP